MIFFIFYFLDDNSNDKIMKLIMQMLFANTRDDLKVLIFTL